MNGAESWFWKVDPLPLTVAEPKENEDTDTRWLAEARRKLAERKKTMRRVLPFVTTLFAVLVAGCHDYATLPASGAPSPVGQGPGATASCEPATLAVAADNDRATFTTAHASAIAISIEDGSGWRALETIPTTGAVTTWRPSKGHGHYSAQAHGCMPSPEVPFRFGGSPYDGPAPQPPAPPTPQPPPFTLTVDLTNVVWQHGSKPVTVPATIPGGACEVTVDTFDAGHAGNQKPQRAERIRVWFGGVHVGTTTDIADAATSQRSTFRLTLPPSTSVKVEHAGDGSSPNSVHGARIELVCR